MLTAHLAIPRQPMRSGLLPATHLSRSVASPFKPFDESPRRPTSVPRLK